MSSDEQATLTAVVAEPGRPLYESVKEALVQAIDTGVFPPSGRLPSTKELSRQMSVSLVTAHRALRELVDAGILERTQGRGTFVAEHRAKLGRKVRIALFMRREASLADYHHSRLLEGMRQASNDQGIELTITHYGGSISKTLDGYVLVNPQPDELQAALWTLDTSAPIVIIGARSDLPEVQCVDVDAVALSALAVEHLHSLGHRRIGYVGADPALSNTRDRAAGLQQNIQRLGVTLDPRHVIHAAEARLSQTEKMHLHRMLRAPDRPTAVFAGGYYFALDVYEAAGTLGLKLPQDLSVVGVENPPSAAYLSPPLTAVHQPLVELGQVAISVLVEGLRFPDHERQDQILQPELVIRRSSAPSPRRD